MSNTFEAVVKIPGISVYVPVVRDMPLTNADCARMVALHYLCHVAPHAVVKVRNVKTGMTISPYDMLDA